MVIRPGEHTDSLAAEGGSGNPAPHPEGNVHWNIMISGHTFDLKNAAVIGTRYTGNVKAEKNIFTRDGKTVAEDKGFIYGKSFLPFTGAGKRAPSRKCCPCGAG